MTLNRFFLALAEDLQTNYIDIGPVNKVLNMLSAYHGTCSDDMAMWENGFPFTDHLPSLQLVEGTCKIPKWSII